MLKIEFFILITFVVAIASATNVKKCKEGQPFPLSVNIEGCDEPPCTVIKGTTAIMYVHILGNKDNTKTLSTKVRATALGLTVPYELPEEVANVCSNLLYDAMCPIYKSEDVIYQFNFYIDTYYPEIPVTVEVSINDENDESVACFICNCRVKKGSTNPLLLE